MSSCFSWAIKLYNIYIFISSCLAFNSSPGKEHEFVFIPQKVADRLSSYATKKRKNREDWMFPISHEAVRMKVLEI